MELKRAEPTAEDVMRARFVGEGHPYYSKLIRNPPDSRHTDECYDAPVQDYMRLLEILMCRERELGETKGRLEALAMRAAGLGAS